jgi:hypothetical protein
MDPIVFEAYRDDLRARLRAQGLNHLTVDKRGTHLVIYTSEPDGTKVNRSRCTWQHGQTFALSVADARGRWQDVGESGTLEALLTLLLDQFGWFLAEW